MANPTNPDGFTGPDDDENFEYAWMASGQRRDTRPSAQRDASVDDALDGDSNYPDIT